MTPTLRFATCAAVFAVVAATASPAAADIVIFKDPVGDAPARYDLTRTSVFNGPERIVVTQRVRGLRGDRTQVYGFNANRGGRFATVFTVRDRGGAVHSWLSVGAGEPPCRIRSRWNIKGHTIRVAVPQKCIPGVGPLRVSTMIGAGNGRAGDPADWTKTVRVQR